MCVLKETHVELRKVPGDFLSAEFLFEETGDQRSAARAETQVVNDTDGPTPGGASAAKLGSPERQASRHPRAGAHGRQVSTEGA